ncbi:MAG: ATP-dependent DNA helicase RecG [Candidatus Andersenbacteria bacterium]|nr:ATP-dependent DNA helicase RecG [Candidatus Andersenbacteria bacterium]
MLELARVGPAKAGFLRKLGITFARDFLYTFPRRYDDFSRITSIASLRVGESMTVRGRVRRVKTSWGFRGRRRLLRIFVDIADDTGVLAVTWYNLRFLPRQLWPGRQIYVAGKVELATNNDGSVPAARVSTPPASPRVAPPTAGQSGDKGERREGLSFRMRSPVIEFAGAEETTHTGRITPVYPETYGVSSRFLRAQVKQLLPLLSSLPEYLPADLRRRLRLIGIHQAISQVHFPTSAPALEQAQARLRFDELFFLQLSALVRRRTRQQERAPSIPAKQLGINKFLSRLSYRLTAAQQRALTEITADLTRAVPMNRLLQGDVGSGKSALAQAAAYLTVRAGWQVFYLAPTEVLAHQQFASFQLVLGRGAVASMLGGLRRRERADLTGRLRNSTALCVIGTHALLQSDVAAPRLALVVIDEQHRFGVRQRAALLRPRGAGPTSPSLRGAGEYTPHLLTMTATPIPRTLNLTVLGDLDISLLDEPPPGRKPVHTVIVAPADRDVAILHILEELHAGRQAYVIAPLVEESDRLEVKSATATAAEMRELFPDIAVGLLHGQMPSAEKERILRHFSAGALQLLVATAIVEVGVNVPNASIMIIEGAERFGLAQLHQFRGRIGRGEHQSYCYLFPTAAAVAANPRLTALAATTDGFVIAEEDLKLRGPGELYGVAQSGFGHLKVASLLDYPTIKQARQEAERLLAEDPTLENYHILRRKVAQKNLAAHFE